MNAPAPIPPDAAAPLFHRFSTRSGEHLLVVPQPYFDLPPHLAALFDTNDPQALLLMQALAQSAAGEEPLDTWRSSLRRAFRSMRQSDLQPLLHLLLC